MTRLPRNLGGPELVAAPRHLGYRVTRQAGRHIRLTCEPPERYHITVPSHISLRVGTLEAILADVAQHQGMRRDELLERLFP
jgi:predicted RNA binding protein YcfA (HicA-like mRNA interferase family)